MLDQIMGGRTRGRRAAPLEAEKLRELRPADLALLDVEGRPAGSPKLLAKLGERHHSLARALAAGMKDGQAAIITGYCVSRISTLKVDPAFQGLLDFYRSNLDSTYADLHERMATLSLDAVNRLQELMEEDPDSLSPSLTLDIVKALADRTGHGPVSKSEVKTLHLTPEDLRSIANETTEHERIQIGEAGNTGPSQRGPVYDKPVSQDSAEGESSPGDNLSKPAVSVPPPNAGVGGVP